MKRGFFHPHRRCLRAALVLPAAALLLYSCNPPASRLTASPSSGVPSAPPHALPEVTRISGLPNMAQIEQRLNDQYAASARSTDGVKFDPLIISGTTVRASITYAEGKLLAMTIGGENHRIKTVTINRVVDGKTIPTTVEYKDESSTTRKTVTSRYVPPLNNARQGLEGGPALHISGEEKDGAGKTLRTFTATERTKGGTTTLKTTYRRPDNEGFTETLTTENGILTQKVVTYSADAAPAKDTNPPAKDETKTETITYEKSAESLFYPAEAKPQRAVAVYKDADGAATKTIETTPTDEGGELAVTKGPDDKEISRVETTTKDGVKLAVHKDADGTETQRINVETRSDGSTITTKTTAGGGTTKELVIHSSVTAIEDNAFKNNKLTSLTIPPSVTAIRDYAFAFNELTSLTIGNGVKTIGKGAFSKNKLTSLTIPSLVTAIGDYAFHSNKLTEVTLSKALYDARGNAFNSNSPDLRFLDHEGRLLGRN